MNPRTEKNMNSSPKAWLVHANPVAATEAPWLLLEAFDHSNGGERAGMRRREEYRKLLEGSGTGT